MALVLAPVLAIKTISVDRCQQKPHTRQRFALRGSNVPKLWNIVGLSILQALVWLQVGYIFY